MTLLSLWSRRPRVRPRPLAPLLAMIMLIFACFSSPVRAAKDILHHPVPLRPWKRETKDSRPLKISNNCADVIWPAISTQAGTGPETSGFKLAHGESKTVNVSSDWQGRVWGRTNCMFDGNRGGHACETGDCGGALDCKLSGETPVTLAEFSLDSPQRQTYYDISLVDGYNLDMAIVSLNSLSDNATLRAVPPNITNPSCIASTAMLASSDYNPYGSSGGQVLGTNASFPLPWEKTVDANTVSRWCPWPLQLNPPSKPGDGVYPYPDDNIQRPVYDPCYSACAKNNKPEDCCTGKYDDPNKCKPSEYSKNAKRVCPDAYSFAFDDQTSTFIIPTGAGFEIAFCPGGRSTDILRTASAALHQLASSGHVQPDTLGIQGAKKSVATESTKASKTLTSLFVGIIMALVVDAVL